MPTLKNTKQKQDKERQAYAYYVSQGWAPQQAVGIVGNLIHESNLDTSVLGTADDKGSRAIAQWHGERLKTLKDKYGEKWTDFKNQLEFVNWELNNTEKKAGDALRKSQGVWEAGRVFSDLYERPKVRYNADDRRQRNVTKTAMKFKDIKLTSEDMPYFEATYANSVAPYINQEYTEKVTPNINYFNIPKESPSFVATAEVADKEGETVDKEVEKVEKESNFLREIENLQKEDYSYLQPAQKQVQQELPQTNFLQQYEQVSQFIDEPLIAQQGGQFTKNELAFLSEIAVKDNNGYWNPANQGKVVEIQGNQITMEGVNQDLIGIGIDKKGKKTEQKIMQSGKNYNFEKALKVIEIPLFKSK